MIWSRLLHMELHALRELAAQPQWASCFAEMGVLRQNLTEREEEKSRLDRKVTELSATISSTLASYAFLEQALEAETTKYDCLTQAGHLL